MLDPTLRPMAMPEVGVIISEALANALDVRRGERVTVEVLEGARPIVSLPVSGISLGHVGLGATMDMTALISGVNLQIDEAARGAFYAAANATPKTEFLTVTALTIARFKETLAENITVMITVYVLLAAIIAIGVVYNFACISLSEQGRELASLRVLGFTRNEVARVLLGELAIVVLMAQPLGWVIGYGIGAAMVAAFFFDLYRVPFVVGREVYTLSATIAGKLSRIGLHAGDPVIAQKTVVASIGPAATAFLDSRSRAVAEATMAVAESAVDLAHAQVVQAEATLEFMTSEANRARALFEKSAILERALSNAVLEPKNRGSNA